MGNVAVDDALEEPLQGGSELHGMKGNIVDDFLVGAMEGVVHNRARASFALRDYSSWGNA
jgi:hypothetical protein